MTRALSSAVAVRKPTHPRYIEMVSDAIKALKERSGSSHYAIAKHMEGKHAQLPSNFKKLLLNSLKKFVNSGKIVKVKGSFKLPPARPPANKKPAAAAKPKSAKSVKVAAEPAPKSKTVAKSVKAKAGVKAKAVAKPAAKPKAVAKRRLEAKEKPAKAARTLSRTSPGKKVATTSKPGKKVAKNKSATPVKTAKLATVKSPAKKAAAKRGKK